MDTTTYNSLRHYDANTAGRDFIVGDIHGCFDFLMKVLQYLDFDYEKDRLFSVGDLIDRGPRSLDCALLIYQDWFHAVRGNHEQMMIDSVIGTDDVTMWVMNGGRWGFQELPDPKERAAVAKLMDKLPYIITVGEGAERFNICHAEMTFAPDVSDELIDAYVVQDGAVAGSAIRFGEPLIWGRDIVSGHPAPHTDQMSITYVGHTPCASPMIAGKHMYLDGGAVFGESMFVAEHAAKVVHCFTAGGVHHTVTYDELADVINPRDIQMN